MFAPDPGRAQTPIAPDLCALADRLPSRPVTRFAPSPTGFLHLGHVVNAIYVWGLARALDGRVVLRLEDHDRQRWRPAFEAAILDDLEWLGLEPDLGVLSEFRAGASAYRQSDVPQVYEHALARLRGTAPVFACRCSRKEIGGAGTAATAELRYPGRCRTLGLEDGPGLGLRLALAPGVEHFDDALVGPQQQDPWAQCGDLLLRDRHGCWTYQFSVVVDDVRHGIDLVVRGADLLDSTGRQIRLARLLGRSRPPVFVHHPLVMKSNGEKLSKSSRDTGVRDLRAAGHSPADVIGLAAHACGLIEMPAPVHAADLAALFTR